MKKIFKLILVVMLPLLMITACDDLLDVNSDRIVTEDEYGMTSANDTLYSMFGVFSQLQKLSNSYVLLGELRGDLMDVGEFSDQHLIQISNFEYDKSNPYTNNIKDYYAVINNCNYIIARLDTSVITSGKRMMVKTYAAAKAVRAWTYLQIMLNYGKATYYEKPILTLEDANAQYPVYTDVKELADVLIQDIAPFKSTEKPDFGSLFTYDTQKSMISIRFLLGDLYLWKGEYEKAATEYRDLMYWDNVLLTNTYKSYYTLTNNAFNGNAVINWVNIFDVASSESITELVSTNKNEVIYMIDSLIKDNYIVPSELAVKNWSIQKFVQNDSVDTIGDLRRYGTYARLYDKNFKLTNKYEITKYQILNYDADNDYKRIFIYRSGLLYLRYAEAVNRLGKPHLAMAVLKNGMKKATLISDKLVPKTEKDSILKPYMDFNDVKFNNNIGVRARNCGNINLDTVNYIIPKTMTDINEQMDYVEDLIISECALETAFEGNRFHDLMRVAIRRDKNEYLADRISAKHTTNKEAIKSKLMNRSNWFLK
jgi:hypothetical protein